MTQNYNDSLQLLQFSQLRQGPLKFIYSEKATKFCEIFHLLLTVCTVVKSKGKISQNFVAFSEYMNFTRITKQKHVHYNAQKINLYLSTC